jgi:hypothetical protein
MYFCVRQERLSLVKRSSLLRLFVGDEERQFYDIDTRAQCYKTFLSVIYEFS